MAQKKKKAAHQGAVINRRARFDYELGDELVVGLVLSGPEVRAARNNAIGLKGSFVTLRSGALWLNNASFTLPSTTDQRETAVDTSPRKLLAHKRQIDAFEASKQTGMSIVPVRLLTAGRYVKLVIALGKGKRNYDKRQAIKKRDQERDTRRTLTS
jgi:SsrA-binding protein